MRQVLQFLREAFLASDWHVGSVSALEMTLHDALRLCAAARARERGAANEPALNHHWKAAVGCRLTARDDRIPLAPNAHDCRGRRPRINHD